MNMLFSLEEIAKIFKPEENIDLVCENYIKTQINIQNLEQEEYKQTKYYTKYYIDCLVFKKGANQETDDPIASLESSYEWITDSKNFRYFEIFQFKDNIKCPLLYCHINTLYVDEEYRGCGYGSLLLEHLEECSVEIAKKFSARYLYMTLTDVSIYSETLDSIYIKQGFEYKSERNKSSLMKVVEFENGEIMINLRISESKLDIINKALDLFNKRKKKFN